MFLRTLIQFHYTGMGLIQPDHETSLQTSKLLCGISFGLLTWRFIPVLLTRNKSVKKQTKKIGYDCLSIIIIGLLIGGCSFLVGGLSSDEKGNAGRWFFSLSVAFCAVFLAVQTAFAIKVWLGSITFFVSLLMMSFCFYFIFKKSGIWALLVVMIISLILFIVSYKSTQKAQEYDVFHYNNNYNDDTIYRELR